MDACSGCRLGIAGGQEITLYVLEKERLVPKGNICKGCASNGNYALYQKPGYTNGNLMNEVLLQQMTPVSGDFSPQRVVAISKQNRKKIRDSRENIERELSSLEAAITNKLVTKLNELDGSVQQADSYELHAVMSQDRNYVVITFEEIEGSGSFTIFVTPKGKRFTVGLAGLDTAPAIAQKLIKRAAIDANKGRFKFEPIPERGLQLSPRDYQQ